MAAAIAHHGAAKCAIDIALHDLVGKRLGLPVRELLGIDGPIPPTDFTLGHRRAGGRRRAGAAGGRLPGAQGQGRRSVRPRDASARCARCSPGPIRVDANTGWTPDGRGRLLPELQRLGVELIEQPFPARRLDDLRALQARSPLPLVADESAVTIEDLDAPGRRRRRRQRQAREVRRHRPGPADARAGARARVPDVPRLHGGDLDRDRGVGRRRPARRLGGPRRLPAARRRPGRRAWSSAPTSAGGCRTRPASGLDAGGSPTARLPDAAGAVRPQLSADGRGPVHRGLRAVDKSGATWWRSPYRRPGAGPRMYRSPVTEEGPREGAPARQADTAGGGRPRPAAGPDRARPRERRPHIDAARRHRRLPVARGRGLRALLLPAPPRGWPELYDEMCAVATRGLFRGMGHEALAEIGVGFSLFETPRLAALVPADRRPRSRRRGAPRARR